MTMLDELYALMKRDPDVKTMVHAVCARDGIDIFTLFEEHRDVFDELYDTAFDMVAQIPADEL